MNKKILFLSNHFITLYSFRKELINRLVMEGYDVYLSLPKNSENQYFEDIGCTIIETPIDRRGVNPARDIALIFYYKKIIKNLKPDVIFSYTIKPNIYGCLAHRNRYKQICNITGTGATFLKDSLVSKICKVLYRMSVKNAYKVFFQNSGDRDFFLKNRMIKDNYELIPGSGCNLVEHSYTEMPNDDNIRFIFIGRVMEVKGIDEYLQAAKMIKQKYEEVEFYVAGWNEEEEYKTLIEEYINNGIIKYLGFRKDIDHWITYCHCTVLPSHGGEGIPNVLLESAAMGRICIGSNIAGISDVISEGKNGFLFNVGDYLSLFNAMESVIHLDQPSRQKMGLIGREIVEKKFDRNIIIEKYLHEIDLL